MKSIVLELQNEAYKSETSISVLLRKAYTIAKKLRIEDFADWANLELNGYKENADILPDYRKVHGQLKALNPYHGYIPVYVQKEVEEIVNHRNITVPATEIELYVKQGEENTGFLIYNFPAEAQQLFSNYLELPLEVILQIPVSQFSRIIDRIRNIILDWTLKLEEEGIFGEGMTFSEKEKEKAVSTTPIINYIGNMVNSQIQQNTQNSQQSMEAEGFKIENLVPLIQDLRELQEELKEPRQKEELASEIIVLESQVNSPNPKKGIITETLKSVRNIAEGTTGSLVATGIQDKVAMLLSAIGLS